MRTTEIKLETEELYVRQTFQSSVKAWCSECGAEVRMITPHEAALNADVNTRTIYRWLEDGRLHFIESSRHELLICSQSLA